MLTRPVAFRRSSFWTLTECSTARERRTLATFHTLSTTHCLHGFDSWSTERTHPSCCHQRGATTPQAFLAQCATAYLSSTLYPICHTSRAAKKSCSGYKSIPKSRDTSS